MIPNEEISEIADFVASANTIDRSNIASMEDALAHAIGYSQRIGTLVNDAEYNYSVKMSESLSRLQSMEDETETTRKAKLNSWTASDKKLLQDLKVIKSNLKTIQMFLMQAIKTRREER